MAKIKTMFPPKKQESPLLAKLMSLEKKRTIKNIAAYEAKFQKIK
jgi:hypothetical protein